MLTILEGPDGGGKTTLARHLTRVTGVTDHHGPYSGIRETARYYWESVVRSFTQSNVVMDRSWLSEDPYRRVFRPREDPRISSWDRRMLERGALGASAVVVWCLPPFEDCLRAFEARRGAEYLEDQAQLRAVYFEYLSYLEQASWYEGAYPCGLPWVVYSHRNCSPALLEEMIRVIRPPFNNGPGFGHFREGAVLMVGERPNQPELWGVPFVRFDEQGCSRWLARQLDLAGVPEPQLYWVSVEDELGGEVKPHFVEQLRPHTIIALGQRAARWCVDHRFAHEQVPHPQHWKRFHHSERYPLIDVFDRLREEG